MPPTTTECIILRSQPYSETSKILRLLTPDHGVRSVMAKGALRPRSQFGGVLEPFARGRATIYLSSSRDLHTLTGFDLEKTGQALGRDLTGFAIASLLAEIILRTGSETPDPELYHLLKTALERIEAAGPDQVEPIGLAEVWALTAHLGFSPIIDSCTACGRELDQLEECCFDYAAGGTRCLDCGQGGNGMTRTLPPHAREALFHFLMGEAIPIERTAAHWALLSRFLTFHLAEGGQLHSLQFLGDAIAADLRHGR